MNRTAIAAMIAAVAGTAVAQPVQWRVEDGGNGHWYEVLVAAPYTSWSQAGAIASARGGYLATVTSAAEWSFVKQVSNQSDAWIGPDSICGPWLGGYQNRNDPDHSEPTGGWQWVTGEPFSFTDWGGGEPNNDCGGVVEDYLCMWDVGNPRWNDLGDPSSGCNVSIRAAVIEFSADCNNDGIVDKGQILAGDLPDTNNNGIPDGPGIAVQPTDQSVSVGNAATFIVQVAAAPSCTTPVTYQWQRRNPAVADPAAPGAWIDLADDATFSGAKARNLSITNPIPALATGYRCKIDAGCSCKPADGGVLYTDIVNFTIACPADFNADGGVDFTDVEAFFERWENGC